MFYFSVSLSIHGGTYFYFCLWLQYISVSTKLLHALLDNITGFLLTFCGYGLVCIIVVMSKLKVLNIWIILNLLIIMSLLLIGGIERNPGPPSECSVGSNTILSETEHIIEDNFLFYIIMYRLSRICHPLTTQLDLHSTLISQNLLITGDFNLDILKNISNGKIRDLCQQINFEQLINEPTHFTEKSSPLIYLILTINKNNLLISGVGEPFLEQNIRYHCPVFCSLNFAKPLMPLYQRKIYLYDRGNYQTISNDLMQTDLQSFKCDNVDICAEKNNSS